MNELTEILFVSIRASELCSGRWRWFIPAQRHSHLPLPLLSASAFIMILHLLYLPVAPQWFMTLSPLLPSKGPISLTLASLTWSGGWKVGGWGRKLLEIYPQVSICTYLSWSQLVIGGHFGSNGHTETKIRLKTLLFFPEKKHPTVKKN